ncbi:MAG: hypothetical protein HY328_02390 [Chloroflexi bacterium]|nr:hypothetical protein [Chloroflexota bacterium]
MNRRFLFFMQRDPPMLSSLDSLLRRTRQHHALEHATIHLLAAAHPYVSLAGLSDPLGFTLYGNVATEAVWRAAREALLRLQAGEAALALHPNCGTNLATSVVLATAAALVGSAGRQRRLLDRIASTGLLMMAAIFLAGPVGMRLQQYTTLADVGDRWLVNVQQLSSGRGQTHRITFGQ